MVSRKNSWQASSRKKGMNISFTIVTKLKQIISRILTEVQIFSKTFYTHYLNKFLIYLPTTKLFVVSLYKLGEKKQIRRKAYLFNSVVLHFLTESIQKFNNSQLTDSVLRYLQMMQ